MAPPQHWELHLVLDLESTWRLSWEHLQHLANHKGFDEQTINTLCYLKVTNRWFINKMWRLQCQSGKQLNRHRVNANILRIVAICSENMITVADVSGEKTFASIDYGEGFSGYSPCTNLFIWTWLEYLNDRMHLQRIKYALKPEQAFDLYIPGQCFVDAYLIDQLSAERLQVDGIPLSRPKRNIARDFSDGVLAAEVVAHYCPRLVDIHNYSAANSLAQKIYNWNTLNNKGFRRLNFSLTKEDVEAVANAENQMIERILKLLKYKIAKYRPIKTESMKHEPNGHGNYPMKRSPPRMYTPPSRGHERRLSGNDEILQAVVRSQSYEAGAACEAQRPQDSSADRKAIKTYTTLVLVVLVCSLMAFKWVFLNLEGIHKYAISLDVAFEGTCQRDLRAREAMKGIAYCMALHYMSDIRQNSVDCWYHNLPRVPMNCEIC
ncbi:hypothetical protein SELMODRAFT_429928 [Selaginella moellendorffii]|uniref:Calponin-homology (CH) domain-containing protein n=1 Tax=Selaginella moellendorffii TaxID=88036 RepID=D8T7S0_SELML|nr:hypothetical protein SELMODRAFT_429928 [Selaginella moellendorffii]